MPAYKVFVTSVFEKKLAKTDSTFQAWFENALNRLADDPRTGKPLGAGWFREKKHGKMRVYYLIYESIKSVYVVNLSEKKDQQRIINSIRLLFDLYGKEIEELAK